MQVLATGRWSKTMRRWAMVVPMRRVSKDAQATQRPATSKQPRKDS